MAENTHWSLGRGGSVAERSQLLIFEIYTTQLETLVYKHPKQNPAGLGDFFSSLSIVCHCL